MKITKAIHDPIVFLKIFEKSTLWTSDKICKTMSISLPYFNQSIQPYIPEITINNEMAAALKLVCNEKKHDFSDKIYSECLTVLTKRKFYLEEHLATFISAKFLLEESEIDVIQAKFLLHQNPWRSLRDIKEKKDLLHDRQVYRQLKKSDSPYMKISTVNGEKSSLTRYFRL